MGFANEYPHKVVARTEAASKTKLHGRTETGHGGQDAGGESEYQKRILNTRSFVGDVGMQRGAICVRGCATAHPFPDGKQSLVSFRQMGHTRELTTYANVLCSARMRGRGEP